MPLDLIRERTAARKAAGLIPAYTPAARPDGKPRRVSLPCVHRGAELSGPERSAAGLGHARRWRWCLHEAKPLGEAVCGCKGCGPRCPGYEAGDGEGGG